MTRVPPRRHVPLKPLLLLLALAQLPTAGAGSADEPEVRDAAGDVQAFGVPAAAGLEWADIHAAYFTRDKSDILLTILVGGDAPPQGEVGTTFAAGDKHYIAGYTIIPGLYSGGFLSESNASGDVPDSITPKSMPATWNAHTIQVTFPVAELPNVTVSLQTPWAWSESLASNGDTYRLDSTEEGRTYDVLHSDDIPASAQGPDGRDLGEPHREAPSLALPLLCIGILFLTARRRPA